MADKDALELLRKYLVWRPHGTYYQCRVCLATWWGDFKYHDAGEQHRSDCELNNFLQAEEAKKAEGQATLAIPANGGGIVEQGTAPSAPSVERDAAREDAIKAWLRSRGEWLYQQPQRAEILAAFDCGFVAATLSAKEKPHELKPGEKMIGPYAGPDGKVTAAILLPGEKTDIGWNEAVAWAKQEGGDLPNRVEQAMLWAHHAALFQKRYYWSNEQYADDSVYAWAQSFNDGFQSYWHKDDKFMARAVRRVTV